MRIRDKDEGRGSLMIVLDLDGCISDDTWRLPFIQNGNYDLYNSLASYDQAVNLEKFIGRIDIYICTARPSVMSMTTIQWLYAKGLRPAGIAMRAPGDDRSSPELKLDQALHLSGCGLQIEKAYDDRADVVSAYRSVGINAEQLCARRMN